MNENNKAEKKQKLKVDGFKIYIDAEWTISKRRWTRPWSSTPLSF